MSEFDPHSPESEAAWQRFLPRMREEAARKAAGEPGYSDEQIAALHALEQAVTRVETRRQAMEAEVVTEAEQITKDAANE